MGKYERPERGQPDQNSTALVRRVTAPHICDGTVNPNAVEDGTHRLNNVELRITIEAVQCWVTRSAFSSIHLSSRLPLHFVDSYTLVPDSGAI